MILEVSVVLFFISGGLAAANDEKPYPVPNPTNGTCLYDGLTMGDPQDPTAYYVCCKNLWFFHHCLDGYLFDKYKLTCVPDDSIPTRHSFTEPSETCEPRDRQKNPFDVSKFDECVNGTHWETKSCPSGSNFNPNTKQCQQLPTTVACRRGDVRPLANGDRTKYLICDGQKWLLRSCLYGSVFDPNLRTCIRLRTTRRPVTRRPLISSSTSEPNGKCEVSLGQNGYKPNPEDCRTYFQCVHNEWMKRDCGSGTKWVQAILGCDYYNGSC